MVPKPDAKHVVNNHLNTNKLQFLFSMSYPDVCTANLIITHIQASDVPIAYLCQEPVIILLKSRDDTKKHKCQISIKIYYGLVLMIYE